MKKVLLIIIGAIAMGWGVALIIGDVNLRGGATVKTMATVVSVATENQFTEKGRITTYYPVLGYVMNGREVNSKSSQGYKNEKYSIGDDLLILYNPNNLEKCYIITGNYDMLLGIGAVVIGLAICVCGAYLLSISQTKDVKETSTVKQTELKLIDDNTDNININNTNTNNTNNNKVSARYKNYKKNNYYRKNKKNK